jgi:hypothetical protein
MKVMILVFVLLIVAMVCVVKFCKNKKIKISLAAIILIMTCYSVVLSIDMNRVKSLREPIFAKENGYMGSMIRYDGFGYKVGLEKDEKGNITQIQMTMFGKIIVAAIS